MQHQLGSAASPHDFLAFIDTIPAATAMKIRHIPALDNPFKIVSQLSRIFSISLYSRILMFPVICLQSIHIVTTMIQLDYTKCYIEGNSFYSNSQYCFSVLNNHLQGLKLQTHCCPHDNTSCPHDNTYCLCVKDPNLVNRAEHDLEVLQTLGLNL